MADDANLEEPTKSGTISQVRLKKDDNYVYYDVCDAKGRNDMANLLEKIYPVGSIYISTIDVSPHDFIGGEWERIENSFLLAASAPSENAAYAAGSTGGDASYVLQENQVPLKGHSHTMTHNHTINKHGHTVNNHKHPLNNHKHPFDASHSHVLKERGNNIRGLHRTQIEDGGNEWGYSYQWDRGNFNGGWIGFGHRPLISHGDGTTGYPGEFYAEEVNLNRTTGDGGGGSTKDASASTNEVPLTTNNFTGNTSSAASSATDPVNNMPPYLAVYMWKRTA